MSFLSKEQRVALQKVADSEGWEALSLEEVGLIAWAALQYFVIRLNRSREAKGGGFK